MATKSSIHIKPCNITSSEAHNRRTPEYMRNIGDSKIYIVPELSDDNEQWINPSFGNVALQTHYDNIKRMVKEKTGRAMQEKERERKGKNGKIIQGGIYFDKQYPFTDRRTTCYFNNLSVLAFALTFLLLHGTPCLFLDHTLDIVIMCLQTDIAEVRIYPLLVIGREFGNDIDFGVPNVTHVFGSPAVMSLAGCDVARLDMYAAFCCHFFNLI